MLWTKHRTINYLLFSTKRFLVFFFFSLWVYINFMEEKVKVLNWKKAYFQTSPSNLDRVNHNFLVWNLLLQTNKISRLYNVSDGHYLYLSKLNMSVISAPLPLCRRIKASSMLETLNHIFIFASNTGKDFDTFLCVWVQISQGW